MKQKIRSEEIEIEVVERRKLIDVEEQEILRKDKELISTVRAPAAAESFKVETLAQGRSAQKVLQAQAEAEKIKVRVVRCLYAQPFASIYVCPALYLCLSVFKYVCLFICEDSLKHFLTACKLGRLSSSSCSAFISVCLSISLRNEVIVLLSVLCVHTCAGLGRA